MWGLAASLGAWRRRALRVLLRGPGRMTVPATAYSDPANSGSGRDWGARCSWCSSTAKGRVFHTTFGHDIRRAELARLPSHIAARRQWAATAHATQPVPATFPPSYRLDVAAHAVSTTSNGSAVLSSSFTRETTAAQIPANSCRHVRTRGGVRRHVERAPDAGLLSPARRSVPGFPTRTDRAAPPSAPVAHEYQPDLVLESGRTLDVLGASYTAAENADLLERVELLQRDPPRLHATHRQPGHCAMRLVRDCAEVAFSHVRD